MKQSLIVKSWFQDIYNSICRFIQYLLFYRHLTIAWYRYKSHNAKSLPFTDAKFIIPNPERMKDEHKNDILTISGYCHKRIGICSKFPYIYYGCTHEIEYDGDLFVRGTWSGHAIKEEIIKSIAGGIISDDNDCNYDTTFYNAKIHFLIDHEHLKTLFN